MQITSEQFKNFWMAKGRHLITDNPKRFLENICEEIDQCKDSVKLDDMIREQSKGRESKRQVVVQFYNYLYDTHQVNQRIESALYELHFWDDPMERRLEMLKFLHTEKTKEMIEEKFDITNRTVNDDLNLLETGITFLGANIKAEKQKKGKKYYYHSTVHPIFLPLNLTEVYALTVYLKNTISDGNPNAEIIRNISERIKSQLSDYARERLYGKEDYHPRPNNYINDEALATQREGILMYLMKSGQKCRFFYKEKEYEGIIDFDGRQYFIRLTNGKILDADINEVEFIIDGFKYI